MTVRTWCLGLGVLACGLALAVTRAQGPARPPGPDKQADLDRARSDVLRALEQFREAEARLRQAEKRLRELEGKAPAQAADESRTETRVFALKSAVAADLAKVLGEAFGRERLVISVDERTNALIVRGRPLDLLEVEALIQRLDQPGGEGRPAPGPDDVFIYRLKNAEAIALAKVLTQVFGQGRAHIVAEPVTNALLVRARDDDRRQIERLIQELDQLPTRPTRPDKQPMK
jgi:type II secretory pathway component GspD/PulD (secretin)